MNELALGLELAGPAIAGGIDQANPNPSTSPVYPVVGGGANNVAGIVGGGATGVAGITGVAGAIAAIATSIGTAPALLFFVRVDVPFFQLYIFSK